MEPEDTCGRSQKSNALSVADSIKSHVADGDHSLFFLERQDSQRCARKKSASQRHQDNLQTCVAKIVHHIVRTGHIAVNPTSDAYTQQGRGESSCCRACQSGSPTQSPGLLHAASATLVPLIWFWLWRGVAETTSFHGTTFLQLRRPRRPRGLWRVVQVTQDTCVPFARARATPSLLAASGLAEPSQWRGHTKVVSTASCAPPNSGKPSATTSNRRPSRGLGTARSMSLTIWLVVTRGPALWDILAPALSTAKPRLPNTPALEHAARWWPQESSGRAQRHRRQQRGRGRRKQPKRSTRKSEESIMVKKLVGPQDKAMPALGPLLGAQQRLLWL